MSEQNPHPNREWLELSQTPPQEQQLDPLDGLLIAFQMETREMMPEAVAIWKAKLREFQLWEVRDAIAEFIGSRTREDARGVVLGDLTAILYVNRERRAREAAMGETQRNIARWQEEQKRDMEADPEGFEQAKAAFREKFKEIAKSKSMSQVGNQAAGIVDATDVKA